MTTDDPGPTVEAPLPRGEGERVLVVEAPLPRGEGERVLVVEDEGDIADLLAAGLRFVGFDVRVARTGADALAEAASYRPDLVLLDVMLPDINGFELCRQLRREHDHDALGVVFLTARNRTEDAVAGLMIGGDDYIDKPFSLDEVVARIRAVLRRTAGTRVTPESERDGVLRLADLELDEVRHEVRRGAEFFELSPREFALLRYLMINRGHVVSKAQILAHVWSYDFGGGPQVVESYISHLRRKIDRVDPPLIHTVRGVGYALRVGRPSRAGVAG
jgi:two-component system OmpR family response regulator